MAQQEKTAWFKRTEYDRSDSVTRTQLLRAAERVFAEEGYARAPIARIADEAGVSRATFYVYFTSRQAVFAVLIDEIVQEAAAAQRVEGIDPTEPRAVNRAAIRSILDTYCGRAGLVTIFEQQSKLDTDVAAAWEKLWSGQITRGSRFIQRLQDNGAADPDVDAEIASESMTAVLLHYGLRNPEADDARIEELTVQMSAVWERLIGYRG
jgi:AcrR family transcriptional regulator